MFKLVGYGVLALVAFVVIKHILAFLFSLLFGLITIIAAGVVICLLVSWMLSKADQ